LSDLLRGEVADYQQHSLPRGIMAAVKGRWIFCCHPPQRRYRAIGGVGVGCILKEALDHYLIGDNLCLIPLLDQAGDPPLPG